MGYLKLPVVFIVIFLFKKQKNILILTKKNE